MKEPTPPRPECARRELFDEPEHLPAMVSLEELSRLLTRFTELADKRQARCWSPTRYADGTTQVATSASR